MAASTSQRQGAKPVLKSGAKWPAITLHTPPILQATRSFEGADACSDLQKHLLEAAQVLQPDALEEGAEADAEVATPENSSPDNNDVDDQQQSQCATDEHEQSAAPDRKQQCAGSAVHAEVERCSGVEPASLCSNGTL
jgi:hypothetical protein